MMLTLYQPVAEEHPVRLHLEDLEDLEDLVDLVDLVVQVNQDYQDSLVDQMNLLAPHMQQQLTLLQPGQRTS